MDPTSQIIQHEKGPPAVSRLREIHFRCCTCSYLALLFHAEIRAESAELQYGLATCTEGSKENNMAVGRNLWIWSMSLQTY